MKLKAINYTVIVKPEKLVTKTASGIQLAIDTKIHGAAVDRGVIVDIGEDAFSAFKTKSPFAGLVIGDEVIYAKYAGKAIIDEDEVDPETKEPAKYIVLIDNDILCKVEKEAV